MNISQKIGQIMQRIKIQINKQWIDLENIPILINYVAID